MNLSPSPRRYLARLVLLMFSVFALLALSTPIVSAQEADPATPPTSYEELTAEQKTWRDPKGVISCKEHPEFPTCAENPAMSYTYPEDNTAFTARLDGESDVNTTIDIAGTPGRMLDKAADSAFGNAAESVGTFAGDFLVESMTWWIKTESIDISYANVLAGKAPVQKVIGFIMMAGILSMAIVMMISRRTEPAADILVGGVKYILISSLSMVVLSGALHAGDDFAKQMVEDGANEFGQRIKLMLGTSVIGNPGGVLFLGLLAALLSFIQWVMGFIRQAGIVVLYALILFAAAGQLTTWGKQWFPRIAGACIALVLFKPIAAMCYSIGFKLIGTDQSMSTLVTGLMVIALTVIALPSMMAFFSFTGAKVAGGPGAGAVLAGGIAGGLGTAALANNMGGGGGSGTSGGDEQSSFMDATGPDSSSAEVDPSPGNSGGLSEAPAEKGATGSGSDAGSGTGTGADTSGGEQDADLGPGTTENPDASGPQTPSDPGSIGPDLGGAAGAGEGAAAAGGAGAAAATGGATLAAGAALKAVDGALDAVEGAASEMSQDTGPDMQ